MPRTVGRYEIHDEIASGGMATVYLARMRGEVGFARVVAVKMLHAQYAREEAFRAMFLDEARLVSRIRHPNVVATLDVVQDEGELLLVMEYVHGETLARLLRRAAALGETVPLGIVVAILADLLEGLHAAHEATSETGEPLAIVHRDVSPQNVLVASDGVARVADFGVAKAVGRLAAQYSNQAAKGKAGYMPPEQMRGGGDRRADVYAAGVVLWEALAGQRLFTGESFLEIITKVLDAPVPAPSSLRPEVGATIDAVVLRAVAHDPNKRFGTAREMAVALEGACPRAKPRDVGDWVKRIASDALSARRGQLERIETDTPAPTLAPTEATERASSPTSAETVSGLVPSRERPPSSPVVAWAVGGGAVSVIAVLAFLFLRHPAGAAPVVVASPPEPRPTALPPPAPEVTPPPSANLQLASSAIPSATTGRTPRTGSHARPPRPPPPSPTPAPSAPCHWVELPNEEGILIPKKVCP